MPPPDAPVAEPSFGEIVRPEEGEDAVRAAREPPRLDYFGDIFMIPPKAPAQ